MTKKKNPNLKIVSLDDYRDIPTIDEESETPDGFEPNHIDLRHVADRVEARDSIDDKFLEIYLCTEEVLDCSLTENGLNIYTHDDKYTYIYTVIKKE